MLGSAQKAIILIENLSWRHISPIFIGMQLLVQQVMNITFFRNKSEGVNCAVELLLLVSTSTYRTVIYTKQVKVTVSRTNFFKFY